MSSYQLISQPSGLAISVAECKQQLNIASAETFYDPYITVLIGVAAKYCENETWRSLLPQGWKILFDSKEVTTKLGFTKCPIISIDSVKYINKDGSLVTVDASYYTTDIISEPGRIWFSTIPGMKPETMNALQISFTAGYSRTYANPVVCSAVSVATNVLTSSAHGLRNTDIIRFTDLGTVTGISLETDYYLISKTTDTFKVSLTLNGAEVNLTGTDVTPPTYQNQQIQSIPDPIKEAILMVVSDLFKNRENTSYAEQYKSETIDNLLAPYKLNFYYPQTA